MRPLRFELWRLLEAIGAAVLIAVTAHPSAAELPCIGDCRQMRRVDILDLTVGVRIALGRQPVADCEAFANDQGKVDIAQLVSGIDNALHGCPVTQLKRIALPTNDLIYDRFTDTIYASVPSRAGNTGNSIVPINPHTGAVGAAVFVGSEPGALAISDDGQYLYVGLNGSASVRRVNLATMKPELQFSLGPGQGYAARDAGQILVVPGDPHAVVVSMREHRGSQSFAGVAVFDDGVRRGSEVPESSEADTLVFGDSASTLYALNTATTGANFFVMNVGPSGLTVVSDSGVFNGPFTAFSFGLQFADGLLYSTSGEVYDPIAKLPLGRYDVYGFVAADSANRRVFFLRDNYNGTVAIMVFDQDLFVPVATIEIPNLDISGTLHSFLRWGVDGLAFAQSPGFPDQKGGTVVIVRTTEGFPESDSPPAASSAVPGER